MYIQDTDQARYPKPGFQKAGPNPNISGFQNWRFRPGKKSFKTWFTLKSPSTLEFVSLTLV